MIKKKAVAGGIVALAAVLGGGGIFAWTRRTADTETLADNQKYVYAYVTSIEGNELTYMEVDESVVEAYLASSTEDTENTEKAEMAREHQEEVMVQGRREMDRGRLAGCRRELPEQ